MGRVILVWALAVVFSACCSGDDALVLSETDYSVGSNWVSFGGDDGSVDIFLVYPTLTRSFEEADRPYVQLESELMRSLAAEWLAETRRVIADSADIYMPLYRQLNGVELGNLSGAAFETYTCATPRADIFAAFDYYLTHVNKGERPFILYGHSQGAQLVIELATTFLGDEKYAEYNDNHIITYAIGCSVTASQIAKNPQLRFSESADDVGVMVSWNSTTPSEAVSGIYEGFGTWKPGALVTNPLMWTTDETRAPAVDGADAVVDAERGILLVTTLDESQYERTSDNIGAYHRYDVVFFEGSIRQNIKDRIEAFGQR